MAYLTQRSPSEQIIKPALFISSASSVSSTFLFLLNPPCTMFDTGESSAGDEDGEDVVVAVDDDLAGSLIMNLLFSSVCTLFPSIDASLGVVVVEEKFAVERAGIRSKSLGL